MLYVVVPFTLLAFVLNNEEKHVTQLNIVITEFSVFYIRLFLVMLKLMVLFENKKKIEIICFSVK